jgi:hypothetical protein
VRKPKVFKPERFDSIKPLIKRACNPEELPFTVSFDSRGSAKATADKCWMFLNLSEEDFAKIANNEELVAYRNLRPSIRQVENTLIFCTGMKRKSHPYTIHSKSGDIDVVGGVEMEKEVPIPQKT